MKNQISGIVGIVAILPAKVSACGAFFCEPNQPVVQSGEAIVFGVENNHVSMHVLINYEGPAEEFSWLVPLMHEPTLSTGSDPFFLSLFQETVPTFDFRFDFEGGDDDCRPDITGEAVCRDNPPGIAFGAEAPQDEEFAGVQVETGSVGPFDFTILQGNSTEEILGWLAANGYDQYEGTGEILDLYDGFYFLALRLKKDSEVGDITPIVIEYDVEEGATEFACIPIVLTSVAVTDSLPIQVYIFGDSRADPVNFYRVELDDQLVDWVNCRSNPACFYQDYQDRAKAAFQAVHDHAFIVEYAGNSSVMTGKIALDPDLAMLAGLDTPRAYLFSLASLGVPSFGLLDQILDEFLRPPPESGILVPCETFYFPNNIFQMIQCLPPQHENFDAAALTSRLNEDIFQPAAKAEEYVGGFSYLTRLYVDMSRENMVRDPFFRFRTDEEALPDVTNLHSATGIPLCLPATTEEGGYREPSGMEVTLADGTVYMLNATFGCRVWLRPPGSLYGADFLPASSIVVPAYGGQAEDVVLMRAPDGSFDAIALADTALELSSRAMTPATSSPTASPVAEDAPVADPPVDPVSTPVDDNTSEAAHTSWMAGLVILVAWSRW